MCLLSIIVPVFNVEQYLNRCIDSILAQTFLDFELILINDGSTDKSKEICEEYCKKDHRIKLINKENGGLSSARNMGLKIAKGKYIGFVDSDDFISKNMYKNIIEVMNKENCDIGIGRTVWVYEGKEIENVCSTNEYKLMNNREGLKNLILAEDFLETAWDKVYKKELFKDIEFPEKKLHEDTATIYKLFSKSKRSVYIDSTSYFYVQREGSIVNTKLNDKLFYDKLWAIKEMNYFIYQNHKELVDECNYLYCGVVLDLLKKIKDLGLLNKNNEYVKYLQNYSRLKRKDIIKNTYLTKAQKVLLMSLIKSKNIFIYLYKYI